MNLIAGNWTLAENEMDELNPSTGRRLLTAPRSGIGEVASAVAAADEAFERWVTTPGPSRGEVLFRAASLVEGETDRLAGALTDEIGKPLRESRGEVARTAAILRFFAGEGRRAGGRVYPSDGGDLAFSLREALGVVALVTPWNFPLAIPAWKLAPALVAGNTVVLKPAEEASHAATALARCLVDGGLPAGVLNVVCGDADAGRSLVADERVAAVSFTGSSGAGEEVRLTTARRGIRAQLELGGKNVAIVLSDADLGKAASAIAAGAFAFAGQKCTATGLVLAERRIAAGLIAALGRARERIVVGSPSDERTDCGPLIRDGARQRAVGLGAKPRPGPGYFVDPVLRTDVGPSDPPSVEELFAPVLPVVAVEGLDEALAIAAKLSTGLSAAIHTKDSASTLRFLGKMRAGVLAVNRSTTGLEVQAPFGGLKASGFGPKEQGPDALEFYSDSKTVYWSG